MVVGLITRKRSSRPQEAITSAPTEAEKAGLSSIAAGGLAPCDQPCPASAPWRGGSRAFPARRNSGRTSGQEAYCRAGFARPTQTEPAVTCCQIRCPGGFIEGNRVRQGSQVSGSGGAASPPTPSVIPQPKPPTPSTPTRAQIEFRRLQAHVASLTQVVEALANRSSSPNPTPFGQASEAMDSAPSKLRDTAAHLAPLEAHLGSLEAQMASIVTTIEDRLAAGLQAVLYRVPGMIVAHLPQLSVSTSRPKLKRVSRSQAPRPLSQVAEVDEQSSSSTATSEISTGSSSGAPMDPSALLEAPQTFSFHDGGQRPQSRRDRANSHPFTILQ
ncbi:hypothetical protein HPB52_001469 [Rhipicephalus sanguineus]|uniref:Uncharacterized protein n=1 Tax=Rhipicephalus sanguineus TaxID=34632 RepID=A0A9D4SVE4_RHISA|nr:hypothetical protein HPB52_001469 [Rhipicephalus sanguineus]